MSKKNTSKTQIEYIPMGEAKLHRRYKTKVVEDALSQIVERDGVVTGKSLLAEATKGLPCWRTKVAVSDAAMIHVMPAWPLLGTWMPSGVSARLVSDSE